MPINRPVRIVTRDGRTIRGRRLNEDTYHRAADRRAGAPRLARQADIRELELSKTSPMPSGDQAFGSDELADVHRVPAFAQGTAMNDQSRDMPGRRIGRGDRWRLLDRARSSRRIACTRSRSPPIASCGARREPQNWLTYNGAYSSQRHSLLDPDHAGQRDEPRVEMGAAGRGVRRLAIEPARRRRDHVRHPAAERRHGGRREDRPRLLAVPLYAVARRARLLRRQQPRRRDPGRHAVHGHARRASRRHRREERPAALEHRGRRRQARLLDHDGAARREGQGHRRRRRRRVRHPRVHRRVRREDRKEAWRFYTIPGPGEPGHDTWSGDAWKNGGASVWVTGSYDPDLNLDLLGHRQSRAGLESRRSARATTSTPTRWSRSTPTPAR